MLLITRAVCKLTQVANASNNEVAKTNPTVHTITCYPHVFLVTRDKTKHAQVLLLVASRIYKFLVVLRT